MEWLKSEEEVDKHINDLVNRSKGRYITQGVSFNKNCPRQMDLLKKSLMSSASFSGLIKELLALKFNNTEKASFSQKNEVFSQKMDKKPKNIGNFL